MLRGNIKISNLDKKTIKSLSKQMMKFCVDKMGSNHKIKVKLIYDDTPDLYGSWDYTSKVIKIYVNSCITMRDYVSVFIHEYRHSLQPCKRNYHKLYEEYGYNKHPYEVEAELYEKLYYKPLMRILVK